MAGRLAHLSVRSHLPAASVLVDGQAGGDHLVGAQPVAGDPDVELGGGGHDDQPVAAGAVPLEAIADVRP